jgi:hypothetical protein
MNNGQLIVLILLAIAFMFGAYFIRAEVNKGVSDVRKRKLFSILFYLCVTWSILLAIFIPLFFWGVFE